MTDDLLHFVGIDWATEFHQVCLLDSNGKVRKETQVPHSSEGLAALVSLLLKESEGHCENVGIAIEVPRGAIVETLLERGFRVFSINPKQLDRFRDRHTVAGAKDDRRDALVLGDSLRTDRKAFRELAVDAPATIRLRELSRMDESLRESTNRLTNQMREQVFRFAPHLLKLCPSANEPWFWALLEAIGKPEKVRSFPAHRAERILKEHHIRRLNAEQLVAVLREPLVHVAPGAADAAFRHLKLLIPQLQLIHSQRVDCGKEIGLVLEELSEAEELGKDNEHCDAEILLSIPGVGKLIAATMLAEASDPIRRRDYEALRAHGGVAPVTKRSGKKLVVHMRNACNPRLRNAIYHWARVSVQTDTLSKAKYSCLRGRGHSHGRALRGVADSLLRLLMAMLKKHEVFSQSRREAAARSHAA